MKAKTVRQLFVFSLLFLAPPIASAQFFFMPSLGEIRIETPGISEEINLIEVDIALASLGSSVSTRIELDKVFSRIDLVIFDAEQRLRSELLADPEITNVYASIITAFPIYLRLTQADNSLIAELGAFEIYISGRAEIDDYTFPIICESQRFSATALVDVTLTGNIVTGELSANPPIMNFDYDVSCSGLLSPLVNLVLAIPFVQDYVDDMVEEMIVDPVNGQTLTAELFGLDDIIPEVRQSLAAIQTLTPAQRNQIEAALLDAEDYLNRLDLDSGKTLELLLYRRISTSDGEGGFYFNLITNVVEIDTNF